MNGRVFLSSDEGGGEGRGEELGFIGFPPPPAGQGVEGKAHSNLIQQGG